jgi:hypothetical protein
MGHLLPLWRTGIIAVSVLCLSGAKPSQPSAADRPDLLEPNLYKILLAEEKKIAKALVDRNQRSLSTSSLRLGRVYDEAQARVDSGGKASKCEFAALSLANVATFAFQGLVRKGDMASILFETVGSATDDFIADMRNCERGLGEIAQDHQVLKDAYKAFMANGKS